MQTQLLLVSIALCGLSPAADFFVSPAGAGTKDGSSAANAAEGAAATALFNDKLQPGDRLLLGPGNYSGLSLNLAKGGTKGKPKTLAGGPGTVFSSDWTIEKPDKGPTAITLAPGLSHVVVQDIAIKSYCFAVRANPSKDSPREDLVFDDVDIEQVRHGFYLSDCDDLLLKDCDMKRYSKHGFRFDQGCDRVAVKNCVADCSEGDPIWETRTELFTFGFILNDSGTPNTGFVFEDCLATNNIKSNQTIRYTNGDGFVAEGNSQDVTYLRCRAIRNQDGGFDLKVKDVKLTDCVAGGHRRDFRIWYTATLKNCFGGWSQTGLWTKGGPVVLDGCTFFDHKLSSVEIEDKSPGPLTLTNCLLVTGDAKAGAAIGKYDGTGTLVVKTASEAGIQETRRPSPIGGVRIVPAWDATGAAMDSTKHPDKGYSSKRLAK